MLAARFDSFWRAGVTQLVECNLAKVDVAGSNPVSRSKTPLSSIALHSHKFVPSTNSVGPNILLFTIRYNWQSACDYQFGPVTH